MATLEAKLARYEHLIPYLHDTQMGVWKMVDEPMMRSACKAMATVGKCSFLPKDEDSIALLLNFCSFNIFLRSGQNLLGAYVADHPPENEDHRAVQQAYQRSYFAVWEVRQVLPKVGAELRNLFNDELIQVIYPRLAETLQPGFTLAMRVMPLEDFHVLCNSPISIHKNTVENVAAYEKKILGAYSRYGVQKGLTLTVEQQGIIEVFQTIEILSARYPELLGPGRTPSSSKATPPTPRFTQDEPAGSRRVGRNDLCPCGSGKKFKQCCLGRN